jgi:hypothetical protein
MFGLANPISSARQRESIVERIFEYISHRENRQKIMTFIGVFSVVGGVIVTAVFIVAIYLR